MLSRVANSLYWSARYMERAENAARFLLANRWYEGELRGLCEPTIHPIWPTAAKILGVELGDSGNPDISLFLDESSPGSVAHSLRLSRENARSIRDAVASETWETLNVLHLTVSELAQSDPSPADVDAALMHLLEKATLLHGLRETTMVRADSWQFLRLGRHIERADWTLALLEGMYHHDSLDIAEKLNRSIDSLHLAAMLRSCTGYEAFSRLHQHLLPERVAEFLLKEPLFPRSVLFCIQEASTTLHGLSQTPETIFTNLAEQISGRLLSRLRFTAIEEIFSEDLRAHLREDRRKVQQIHFELCRLYFP